MIQASPITELQEEFLFESRRIDPDVFRRRAPGTVHEIFRSPGIIGGDLAYAKFTATLI